MKPIFVTTLLVSTIVSQTVVAECRNIDQGSYQATLRNDKLETRLHALFQCRSGLPSAEIAQNDLTACNWFVGRAIQQEWSISDFWNEEHQRFMVTGEMEALLSSSNEWQFLGTADNKRHIQAAASAAQVGNAVVAIGAGHVALILPGGLAQSSTWKVHVPLAAQMGLSRDRTTGKLVADISKAWVGCRLSRGWAANKRENIKFFARENAFPEQ